jgi:hypothetical protein
MAKITKATFKSFVKKNRSNLVIRVKSKFDGMSDMCEATGETAFTPVLEADRTFDNNLGIQGVWLVGTGGDYFTAYEQNGVKGIEVYNCCGQFVVGVKA